MPDRPHDRVRLNVVLTRKERDDFKLVCPSHGEQSHVIRKFINTYTLDNIGARRIEVVEEAEQLELDIIDPITDQEEGC